LWRLHADNVRSLHGDCRSWWWVGTSHR